MKFKIGDVKKLLPGYTFRKLKGRSLWFVKRGDRIIGSVSDDDRWSICAVTFRNTYGSHVSFMFWEGGSPVRLAEYIESVWQRHFNPVWETV